MCIFFVSFFPKFHKIDSGEVSLPIRTEVQQKINNCCNNKYNKYNIPNQIKTDTHCDEKSAALRIIGSMSI